MANSIGIRREDKHAFEARAPLTPDNVRHLVRDHGIPVWVQSSDIRHFKDQEYVDAGAILSEDLDACPIVFGVKEIPPNRFELHKNYVFFSHIIKGQSYNMPMLRRILDLKCTLIDYERIRDEKGQRLIFFGRHAGLAGMIDTLWAFGKRLEWEGIDTPFAMLKQAWKYASLEAAREAVREVGRRIREEGLPSSLVPLTVGFAGYGNVSLGAQEIVDCLEPCTVAPEDLSALFRKDASNKVIYKIVFEERHMVEPISGGPDFELQDYYSHPEKYRGRFEAALPFLRILVNCIYWDEPYPRLVTKDYLRLAMETGRLALKVIGDIGCDIEGAVEATLRATDPGNPVYVYDPIKAEAVDGVAGEGPVILAVDTLPCELPRDASDYFGLSLEPFVPAIAGADYSVPFEALQLPPAIKGAVLVHRGEFAPEYRYIAAFLEKYERKHNH